MFVRGRVEENVRPIAPEDLIDPRHVGDVPNHRMDTKGWLLVGQFDGNCME
jgi:hypothetical protein